MPDNRPTDAPPRSTLRRLLRALHEQGYPVDGLSSKGWEVFSAADAPKCAEAASPVIGSPVVPANAVHAPLVRLYKYARPPL